MNRNHRERGAILIMTALIMLLLLFIAAFATDLGAWYRQGQAQQQAADVASLNGIQAYERASQDYLAGLGYDPPSVNNAAIPENAREEAERLGMSEAVVTVMGLLETSGYRFTMNLPQEVSFTTPPADGDTVYEIRADDGTIITVTRTTRVDPSGVRVSSLHVSLTDEGEQYFSGLLRDAPTINRGSTAVLSNCSAICDRTVTINPPFAGFEADGSGDGYAPLLNGDTEIWAVNHHSNNNVGKNGFVGDIVCMDRETQAPCAGTALWSLQDYYTPTWPVETLSEKHSKIFFGATRRSDMAGGVACFDVAARDWCSVQFLKFFDGPGRKVFGSMVAGVIEDKSRDQFWAIADTGELGCFTAAMTVCSGGDGTGIWDTAIVGEANVTKPPYNKTNNRTAWAEIYADKMYLVNRGSNNDGFMHCFDLSTRSACWGGAGYVKSGQSDGESMGFMRYSTSGNAVPEGFCLASPDASNGHKCVGLDGSALSQLPGMADAMSALGGSWKGSAFEWNRERVVFAGGKSDKISCYSLKTREFCGAVGASDLVENNKVEPYAFAQVTEECLVGLGDESVFFSINPATMKACVDTKVSTTILPCPCSDGTPRWGSIELPVSLMTKVNTLTFTAYADAAQTSTISSELVDYDVVASNGVIDLSSVPSTVTVVHAEFRVGAKLDDAGKPIWVDPEVVDFKLVVQPTLVN